MNNNMLTTGTRSRDPGIIGMAETILEQLRVDLLDPDTIDGCHDLLMEAICILRQEKNKRTTFLSLPVEVLRLILSWVPEPLHRRESADYQPESMWASMAVDVTTIVPVSRTCRYLRKIVLSDKMLWKTIVTDAKYFPSRVLSRSGDPSPGLVVVIYPTKGFTEILYDFYPAHAHRIEELRVMQIGQKHMKYLQSLLELEHPALLSYAVDGETGSMHKWVTYTLPISASASRTLQDIHVQGAPLLPAVDLPRLTHLALCDIFMGGLHSAIVQVLRHCPNLQALVLAALHQGHPYPEGPPPTPLPPLSHLCRVTFFDIGPGEHLAFYLNLIQHRQDGPNVQVLKRDLYYFDVASYTAFIPGFSQQLLNSHTLVANFDERDDQSGTSFVASLTAIGATKAARIASQPLMSDLVRKPEYRDSVFNSFRLLLADAPRLSSIREVQVLCSTPHFHPYLDNLQPVIAALPSLETLTLAYDHARYLRHGGLEFVPDLNVCSSAHDPFFRESPHLKTLCLCFYDEPRKSPSFVLKALPFTGLLAQLKTGAYYYFAHLVVRTAPHLVPDEGDLHALRAHFATVQVEHVHGPPELVLPKSCIEPKAGVYGSRQLWHGALW